MNFYALKEDIRELVHIVFEETDFRVFESYSRYDHELREFRSFDDLENVLSLDSNLSSNSLVDLQLWSPSIMPKVEVERISLKMTGHSFRYCIVGLGLVQLQFGRMRDGLIRESYYGHWNEKGARQRAIGDVDAVDWSALARLSGRIKRHIRSKMAVASLRGRPILPDAFAGLQRGLGLRYSSLEFRAESPDIQLLGRSVG